MAPNNALAERKAKLPKKGTTTVLDAGTVESRGMGTRATTRSQVSAEITNFLNGEARISVKAETRAFFTVWTFITRLPGPTWVDHHPGYLMRGMAYFPLAGALVGIFVCVFFDLAHVTMGLPAVVSAAMCTAASLWVTGCFHEDGLADASDGIGGGWSRAQILTIMTDTRLGTYGCAVLLLHTVAKLELIAALETSHWDLNGNARGAGPALVVMHTLSRLTSPYLIRTRDYVDEAGPKYKFYSFMVQAKHLVSWHRVLFALFSSYYVATLFYGRIMAWIMIVTVMFVAHLSGMYGEYLLGGIMGDYLGATICITEIVVLTMILAKSSILNLSQWIRVVRERGPDSLWDAACMQDHPIGVLARFFLVIFFTGIWCCFIGHPNVLVRESAIDAQNTDPEDDIRISLKAARDTNSDKKNSGRQVAEFICSESESSFQERFDAVMVYLDSLAKPVGSLGTLENWASKLAALQRTLQPSVDPVACLIFAADHGIAKDPSEGGEKCSSYPQAVTRSVLQGLEHGIAGASVLAKRNHVSLRVVDVGVCGEPFQGDVVVSSPLKIQGGTRNFCVGPAMTTVEVERCIRLGREELSQYICDTNAMVVVLGEVGIGNTTASSALIAQLTDFSVESVCGGGAMTGREVDQASIAKKISIVKKAIMLHGSSIQGAMDALERLGGAEIAALVGAILEASERNLAILVDGFIVTTAALLAALLSPYVCRVLLLATQSAEIGQLAAIQRIQSIAQENGIPRLESPAITMGLRMGEASAALLAVPILRIATVVLSEMGTIQDIISL